MLDDTDPQVWQRVLVPASIRLDTRALSRAVISHSRASRSASR
ncbi:plasmid pRiA4b ORF-3 family protein [Catenulispora rubra]|nr:plasmid pRiA4b ORF-3 family protein [Catenulispora rubra]